MNRHLVQWICLLAIFLLLSACASFNKKFKPSTEANVGIFADNTLAMLAATGFGFTKNNLYTKGYFSYDEPEEMLFLGTRDGVEQVLNIMVRYSLRLVSITDKHDTARDQITAYVSYLQEIDDKILVALELDSDYYAELIVEVGEQKKFMAALKTAQPIVDALGHYMDRTLDELEDAAGALALKIDLKIDVRYADLIRYQKALEKEKYAILSALEQLHLTRRGNIEAYDMLKAGETTIPRGMLTEDLPTYEERWSIVKHQIERLDILHRVVEEIQPDWDLYRETHLELDEIHKLLNMESRKMRLITLVWIRAHQKMAAGIASPAEWFNINEAPSILINMGVKAAF